MKAPAWMVQAALLPLLATAAALVSNATAGSARRLAWTGRPPEEAQVLPPLPVLPTPPSPGVLPPSERPTGSLTPGPKPPPREPLTASAPSPAPSESTGPAREIDSTEALRLFEAGAVFLDARRSADFTAGHVARAFHASVWEADLEEKLVIFEATSGAQADTALVLYCSGGDCHDSHLLAGKLLARGFRRLYIYRDGYPDWVRQGRAIEKGAPR